MCMTNMFDQIRFCGNRSGRDVNKYTELKLSENGAKGTVFPIINTPGIHFECSIIYKTGMEKDNFFGEHAIIYPERTFMPSFSGRFWLEIKSCNDFMKLPKVYLRDLIRHTV